jgi:hypothetical protein
MLNCGNMIYQLNQQQLQVGYLRDPDTGYTEYNIKMNFKQTGARLWTKINPLMY